MMKQKNGFLPGWPPFDKFKKEMSDLVSDLIKETNKPIWESLETVKASLWSYIEKTDENFKKTDENFKEVKLALTNHVTDTDKKIDNFRKEVNDKLDKILNKKS